MSFRILVCEDEAGMREMLTVLLQRAGYDVEQAGNVQSGLEKLRNQHPSFDVVITDLAMPDGSGMEIVDAARQIDDSTQVIMITAYATTEQAVQAMRAGAYDYIQKPFRNHELLITVEKALEKRTIVNENRELRAQVRKEYQHGDVIGKSPAIQQVLSMVRRIASAPSSVFITGESGTGKEMIARALHAYGDRSKEPFVAVNCGAVPEMLMESELFGHEKGAFTGATAKKEGLIRAAHKGTLFLDEVGELPLSLQVKLLRVLQERKIRPVGSNQEIDVDVRFVAATNREIDREVAEGRFRQDLFYRLNVLRLKLPPLRERPEDIPLLAEYFLSKHASLHGKRLSFSPEALRWIAQQTYPGNVRELENIIERAVALALGRRIELQDLPYAHSSIAPPPMISELQGSLDLEGYLGEVERQILVRALERTGSVRTQAAKLLGVSLRSLRYRLAKYNLGGDDDLTDDDGSDPADR